GAAERDETAELARELLRQRFEAEAKKEIKKSTAVTETGAALGHKPWREIATPHPDVASGRYPVAEFAADLFQVITERAEPEYANPKEFFRRTYLTEGLTHLLANAWLRLSGQGGDPVVELQTNFGGGKTHSMLSLYHLFGGKIAMRDVPGLEQVVAEIKPAPEKLPVAKCAVLPCIKFPAASTWRKPDGSEIHTLWGEIAWQLGKAEGYKIVAEEDQHGVSPGSEKITQLFERFGPALVLIDEWVAYARQLIGKENLTAGTFEANMTFAQALTEGAKAARNALVVAAIPESDIEVGGESGRIALERIRNVFGRLEAIWKPASAAESFEIVRRRLFEPISDFAGRDAACRAFSEMYRANRGEFPSECREADYEERMKSAYPIHPELFDRLYQDWSTLDRFQRTRGVLRLMAKVIHELWEREDKSLLIMPGTLPLDNSPVRTEITRYLPEGWAAVIDKDIDGEMSVPLALDRDNPNLGRYSACRRVARTVFIG
ncbi:MAG: ATP-binding protein, partial [bacterium]